MTVDWLILVGAARRITRDTDVAEDVVQDVLLTLLRRGYDLDSVPRPFIYKSIQNQALKWQRQRRQRERALQISHDWPQPNSAIEWDPESIDRDLFAAKMKERIQKLPTRASQVARLHWVDGMSCREIAEVLGITQKSVEKRVTYARSKLTSIR